MPTRRNLAQAYSPEQYAELAKMYAAPAPDAGLSDRDLAEMFGREQGPVYSIGQGLAEAGSKIGEAYLRKQAREKQQKQQSSDFKSLAEALQGASGPMSMTQAGARPVATDQSSMAGQVFSPQGPTPQGPAPDDMKLAALMGGVPDRLKLEALPAIQQQMAAAKAATQPKMLAPLKPGEVLPQQNPDGTIKTAFAAPAEAPKPTAPHVVGSHLVSDDGKVLFTDAAAEAKAKAEAEAAAAGKKPALPQGYERGAEGAARPIPGTAQELEYNAKAKEAQTKQQQDVGAFNAADTAFQTLQDSADKIRLNPRLANVVGSVKGRLPTTDADSVALEADINTLKSQLSLAALQAAKNGSASGASGFGALSEKELALLENSIATLDMRMGAPQFMEKLNTIIQSSRKSQDALRSARGGQTTGNTDATHFVWSPDAGLQPK